MRKYVALLTLIVAVILAGFGLPMILRHLNPTTSALDSLNKQSEEIIVKLQDSLAREKLAYGLLVKQGIDLEDKLSKQKGGITIVENKYGKIRSNIINLPDDSAISYVSKRLNK